MELVSQARQLGEVRPFVVGNVRPASQKPDIWMVVPRFPPDLCWKD